MYFWSKDTYTPEIKLKDVGLKCNLQIKINIYYFIVVNNTMIEPFLWIDYFWLKLFCFICFCFDCMGCIFLSFRVADEYIEIVLFWWFLKLWFNLADVFVMIFHFYLSFCRLLYFKMSATTNCILVCDWTENAGILQYSNRLTATE